MYCSQKFNAEMCTIIAKWLQADGGAAVQPGDGHPERVRRDQEVRARDAALRAPGTVQRR